MLSVIGPGGWPGALLCGGEPPVSTGGVTVAAGLGTGGLGCAQAAAKTPTAITLNQVRITSASSADRAVVHFHRILKPRRNCKIA
jgi:hypothetical protein